MSKLGCPHHLIPYIKVLVYVQFKKEERKRRIQAVKSKGWDKIVGKDDVHALA